MNAHGFNVAEQGHVVNALPPVDIDGGVSSDRFHLGDHDHASIIISLGVTGAASTVTVRAHEAAAGGTPEAIAFRSYAEETAGGDTLAAGVEQSSSGFATSTNDGIFYVIEVSAEQLPKNASGVPKKFLDVTFSDPGAATIGAVIAVLSGARYGGAATGRSVLA